MLAGRQYPVNEPNSIRSDTDRESWHGKVADCERLQGAQEPRCAPRWYLTRLVCGEMRTHGGETFFHIGAAVADAETICRCGAQIRFVHTRGEKKHASLLHEVLGEGFNALTAEVAGKSDATAIGEIPLEKVRVVVEKSFEEWEVFGDQGAVASKDRLASLESDLGQQFAGRGAANRGVVLDAFHAAENVRVFGGYPPQPESSQTIRLGHHTERDAALVEIGDLRKPLFGTALEQTIDFVAEDVNSARPDQGDQGIKRVAGDDLAGGVVGKVDANDAGVGADGVTHAIEVELPVVVRIKRDAGRVADAEGNGF